VLKSKRKFRRQRDNISYAAL